MKEMFDLFISTYGINKIQCEFVNKTGKPIQFFTSEQVLWIGMKQNIMHLDRSETFVIIFSSATKRIMI